MVVQQPRCLKCGKPKSPEQQASITQWMSVCNCDLISEDDVSVQIVTCQNCGKRVEQGRAGSFTQWVFRSDLCSCNISKPVSNSVERTSTSTKKVSKGEERPEVEIEVDSESFPLDRYKPLRLLGSGAAGSVYLCRDRLLNLKVAVKVLRFLNAEQLISFQQEARATSSLNHPNIIKVLNFGASENGAPYMVMEFFSSSSLETLILENGALPPGVVLHIGATLCEALTLAHEQGIFHRDLKSSNILVSGFDTRTPDIRLIDFGVALVKRAHQEPTIIQGITVVGTPRYMPPDQAFGKVYDSRSEIYSLGCVLFEALTGRLPFVADTAMELVSMHANEEPPWLADANPDVEYPEGLESLITSCLAKDPDERFQSMSELRDACLRIASELNSEQRTRQDTEVRRVPSTIAVKNQRTTLKFVAAIAVVILAGSAFSVWFVMREDKEGAEHIQIEKLLSRQLKTNDQLGFQAPTPVPGSAFPEGLARYRIEESLSRVRLSYGKDETLKEVPEDTIIKDMSLYSCSFSKAALKAFLDRPTVSLKVLELSSMQQSNSVISLICSHPKTTLTDFRINSCDDAVTNRSIAALVRQPLKIVRILETDFEDGALENLFERLRASGVKEIELSTLSAKVMQDCGKFFGEFTTLEALSLNNCEPPDSAYAGFRNLLSLRRLYIESEIPLTPTQTANLAAVPHLDFLSVGREILSSEQLKDVLKGLGAKTVRFTKRRDLVSDLEVIRQTKVPNLELYITEELTPEVMSKLKTLRHLKNLNFENYPDSDIARKKNLTKLDHLKGQLPHCEVHGL